MDIINDFKTSVEKSFDEIDPNWRRYRGIVVCGTHTPYKIEDVLHEIRLARENNIPFLGECFGLQLMLIEYARNVLQIRDAISEEFGIGTPIIIKMPSLRVGMLKVGDGFESFWHNYKFNPIYSFEFREDWDLKFEDDVLVIAKYKKNKFHIGIQFHSSYQSSKDKPHFILKKFLEYAKLEM